jgi:hypothetical protein
LARRVTGTHHAASKQSLFASFSSEKEEMLR